MPLSTGDSIRFAVLLGRALLRNPRLVPTAVRQFGRMAETGWWRRPPFLPMPPSAYLEFRQVTATGEANAAPDVDDVIVWLEWCRSMQHLPA